jgi:Helix-turn-helix domain
MMSWLVRPVESWCLYRQETSLRLLTSLETVSLGVVRERVDVILLAAGQQLVVGYAVSVLRHEDQVHVHRRNYVSTAPELLICRHKTNRNTIMVMRLRYNYRVYPHAAQRRALAQAFGCARVVWNDCLRARKEAHAAGLAEVSAVVLQQSLRDLDTAYKNFFDGLEGKRPRMGAPRYKSKKDTRQPIRLNNNAFSLQDNGTVYVAKVGNLKATWSRPLPAAPTSLTVTKDSSGRYFLSFVVDTGPEPLLEPDTEAGIDLGLSAFAVLSDGRKVDSPASCAGPRRNSSDCSGICPVRPRAATTEPRPVPRSHVSTPGWPTAAETGTTRNPRRSFATAKRCTWKTSRCPPSAAHASPSPCTTPDGRSSSRCWSTRPLSTAGTSLAVEHW